jgi:phosphopantetheinyl transferase (holo-ACP synthase)
LAFIGNDIISLMDSLNIKSFNNPRYLEKAYHCDEIALCEKNSIFRYLIWTSKESAYKISLKKKITEVFSPKKFQYSASKITENHSGEKVISGVVRHDCFLSYTCSFISNDFVHTIASDKEINPHTVRYAVKKISSEKINQHSALTREFFFENLNFNDVGKAPEIVFDKTTHVPTLKHNSAGINRIDFSLSHDHVFISCAFIET